MSDHKISTHENQTPKHAIESFVETKNSLMPQAQGNADFPSLSQGLTIQRMQI
jgi:hypothetical protein